jgi:cyanophycinase
MMTRNFKNFRAWLTRGALSTCEALADPFNSYMSFERDFVAIPALAGVIADPHFVTRDRMGRDLAFMGRIFANGWSPAPRAICIDEETALLIDNSTGAAAAVGNGTVYFLKAPGGPEVCRSKVPLTYRNVAVYRIADDAGTFNLSQWIGTGGDAYTVSANAGVLSSTQSNVSPY